MRLTVLVLFSLTLHAQSTVAAFSISERFGVPHPAQVVELDYAGGNLVRSNHRMLGPHGQEVLWQQLSSGKILVYTHLPRSTVLRTVVDGCLVDTEQLPASAGHENRYNGLAVTPVSSACGLTAGTTYYLRDAGNAYARISASYGGAAFDLTSSGLITLKTVGFTVDTASDTVIWAKHNFQTGDPFTLSTTTTLPGGLSALTTYYAIVVDADRIQVASSYANAQSATAIDITSTGTGPHYIHIDWTWTLQSGVGSSGLPGAITRGFAGGNWEIANEYTAVRVRQPSAPVFVSLSASGTTGTLTWTGHGLSSGTAIGLTGCGVAALHKGYSATASDANTLAITIPSGNDGTYSCTAQANTDYIPIQGFRWQTGQWAATGPNYIRGANLDADPVGISNVTFKQRARSVSGYFREVGPLRVVYYTAYAYKKPEYQFAGSLITAAGDGDWQNEVTIEKGRQSIQIEDHTNMQMQYWLNAYETGVFTPYRYSYRGHSSGTCEAGYERGTASMTVAADESGGKLRFTAAAHHRLINAQLRFETTGTLPGGVSTGTTYFVRNRTFDTFEISTASGGISLDWVDAGSGTHTAKWGGCSGNTTVTSLEGKDQRYRDMNQRGGLDAYGDIANTAGAYNARGLPVYATQGWSLSPPHYTTVTGYQHFNYGGGWSAYLYDPNGTADSPVLGTFHGRASKLDFLIAGGGSAFFHAPAGSTFMPPFDGSTAQMAGVTWIATLRAASGRISNTGRVREHWAIFVGKKGDLTAPRLIDAQDSHPINTDFNVIAGINLTKVAKYSTVTDPAGGWKPLFVPLANGQDLVAKIQSTVKLPPDPVYAAANPSHKWFNWAYAVDSGARPILDAIRPNTTAAIDTLILSTNAIGSGLLDIFVNREGINHGKYFIQQGSRELVNLVAKVNPFLWYSTTTAAQRSVLKPWLAIAQAIAWDEDYAPLENLNSGHIAGTANQILESFQNRAFTATAVHHDPALVTAAQLETSRATIISSIKGAIDSEGASIGSSNYVSASLGPALNTAGIWINNLGSEQMSGTIERLKSMVGFLDAWSVRERRFNGRFKIAAFGDGSTMSLGYLPGMLGTMLRPFDATASGHAMWLWQKHGYGHSSFYGSSLFGIDETLTPADPVQASKDYTQYFSSLRLNRGTLQETLALPQNGDVYTDHMHGGDRASIPIYALGAPLGVNFSCCSPTGSSPLVKNGNVTVETSGGFIGGSTAWTDALPVTSSLLAIGSIWSRSGTDRIEFMAGPKTGFSRSTFTQTDLAMDHKTVVAAGDPDYPIIAVYQSFTGAIAGRPKILNWNQMATGAVTKPDDTTETPSTVLHPATLYNQSFSPSAGTPFSLSAGLRRFQFIGKTHSNYAEGCASDLSCGIDWETYVIANSGDEALLGNWGVQWFYNADKPEGNIETQHLLRWRSTGPFATIFLPRRKGSAPTQTVTAAPCGVQIVRGANTQCISGTEYSSDDGTTQVLATFDNGSHTAHGMTISGGPAEAVRTAEAITITVQGLTGANRTVTLPDGFYPSQPTAVSGGNYLLYGPKIGRAYTFTKTPASFRILHLSGSGVLTLEGNEVVTANGTVQVQAMPGSYTAQWTNGQPFTLPLQ